MPKTKPIGIRFDAEKLALIQKEQNLKTPQAVVSYLMDQYHPVLGEMKLISASTFLHAPKPPEPHITPSGLSLDQRIKWLEEHG